MPEETAEREKASNDQVADSISQEQQQAVPQQVSEHTKYKTLHYGIDVDK